MPELVVFFESYSQIVIPVSIGVFLLILYGAPVIGMVTFLKKKHMPLFLTRHKTKKHVKELVWITLLADSLLIGVFTLTTYLAIKALSL